MKEIQFVNKVWISQKGRLLDKILKVCSCIYLLLNVVIILMEGFSVYIVCTSIIALVIILWTSKCIKNNGEYQETNCKITFLENKIIWEYPDINMPIYKGKVHIIYNIDTENIKNISISNKIQSIRIECSPVIEYIRGEHKKIIDYRKNKKSCVLIIYNYNLDRIKELLLKYIGKTIDVVD